jgi:hypothetical protein
MADPFFSNVALLLHFNGSNDSIAFKDSSNNNLSVWRTNSARISTIQSQFGGSSLFLEGTNSYITTPSNINTEFGTGDFTVEAWVYISTTPNGEAFVSDQFTGGSNPVSLAFGFCGLTPGTSGSNIFFGNYSGTSWSGVVATGQTVTLNTWTHLAAVRQSGTLTIYRNGTSIASGAFPAAIGTAEMIYIGRRWDSAGTRSFTHGYIDEVRITNQIARYTANFTPDTVAFEDEAYSAVNYSGDTLDEGYSSIDYFEYSFDTTDSRYTFTPPFGSWEVLLDKYTARADYLFGASSAPDTRYTFTTPFKAWGPSETGFSPVAFYTYEYSSAIDTKYSSQLSLTIYPIWKNIAFTGEEIDEGNLYPSYRKPHRIISSM